MSEPSVAETIKALGRRTSYLVGDEIGNADRDMIKAAQEG